MISCLVNLAKRHLERTILITQLHLQMQMVHTEVSGRML